MKRFLLSLLVLLMLTNVQAQRKKTTKKVVKEPEPQLPQMTVAEALAIYDFTSAEQLLNYEVTTRQKLKEPTLEQEEKLQWLHKAQMKLNAVEQVTFIDSMIVPRSKVLEYIRLNPECGTITSFTSFFHQPDTMDCTVFRPEMGDQVYYSQPDGSGILNLYAKTLYSDGTTSEPTLLKGISNESEHQNYPFMMTDGATIYFAAQGPESLGGYDIFMSRYDADEKRFLAPENIGMPFNSPANDYLYIIDEFNHLGWFATDRGLGGDSVCIYTFIPNETRKVYLPEETSPEKIRQLARITDIKATWSDAEAVRAAQFRMRSSNLMPQTSDKSDIIFIVTDNMVYGKRSDFRSDIAQKLFDSWTYAKEQLQKTRVTLDKMRREYHSANATRRTEMSEEILALEKSEEQLLAQVKQLEKEIRKAELGL